MYCITWTTFGKQDIVYQNQDVRLVQIKLKELKASPQFKGGVLQLRTTTGLKLKRLL